MNVKIEPSDGAVGDKSNAEEKKTDPSDGVKSNAKDLPPNDDPDPPPTRRRRRLLHLIASRATQRTVLDTEVSLSSGKGKLILYSFKSPLYMVLNH